MNALTRNQENHHYACVVTAVYQLEIQAFDIERAYEVKDIFVKEIERTAPKCEGFMIESARVIPLNMEDLK